MKNELMERYEAQEELREVIEELVGNAYTDCDPYWVIQAYGIIECCDTTEKTYDELARILDINENNIDTIDTENDKELLDTTEYILEEAYQADRDGEVSCYGDAETLVKEISIDNPEHDFIIDYSDCIDFEAVADQMFRYDNNIRIFDDDYYLLLR